LIFFETASGRINAIEFASKKPGSDTLLCIHGFLSDARIFAYIGSKLSIENYNVVSIDLPGHGMSDGKVGELDFDTCVESIHQIVQQLKGKSGKIYIVAHSVGCILALWYAHLFRDSIDGLVLFSPSVRVPKMKKRYDADPNALELFLLFFARIITPSKLVDISKAFPVHIKAGGEELLWMIKNSEGNFRYSYRFLVDIFAVKSGKIDDLSDIRDIPVLILHGRKDRMMYVQVSEEFFKLLRTPVKEFRAFDCDHWFYDAIFYDQSFSKHSEQERTLIVSSVSEWLKSPAIVSMDNR
jgi:pimeloyl-ACP methyl ester carboxylesterase